ncbi:MAG: hypothetical protein JNL82_40255 [Myxococcales bacterium]|nr:hypothetical protein [Myxococcales bacterium]
MVTETLDWLYVWSPYKNQVTNTLGVIAHSSGGRIIINNYAFLSGQRKITAIVFMASCFDYNELTQKISQSTTRILTLATANPSDPCDGTVTAEGKPVQSVVGLADIIPGTIVDKTSVFFRELKNQSSVYQHFFQDSQTARLFTTAFMGAYLNFIHDYREILRGMVTVDAPDKTVATRLRHRDSTQGRVFSFEEQPGLQYFATNNIISIKKGYAFSLVKNALPAVKVLSFQLKKTQPIPFPFEEKFSISISGFPSIFHPENSGYKYLAYSIGQVYDPARGKTNGVPWGIRVSLGLGSLANGPEVPFVIKQGIIDPANVRSALATYAIPLSKLGIFGGGPILAIHQVTFEFVGDPADMPIFMISDAALWRDI